MRNFSWIENWNNGGLFLATTEAEGILIEGINVKCIAAARHLTRCNFRQPPLHRGICSWRRTCNFENQNSARSLLASSPSTSLIAKLSKKHHRTISLDVDVFLERKDWCSVVRNENCPFYEIDNVPGLPNIRQNVTKMGEITVLGNVVKRCKMAPQSIDVVVSRIILPLTHLSGTYLNFVEDLFSVDSCIRRKITWQILFRLWSIIHFL